MEKYIRFKKVMFFPFFIFILINGSYGQKTLPVYDVHPLKRFVHISKTALL